MKERQILKLNHIAVVIVALFISLYLECFLEVAKSSDSGFINGHPENIQIFRLAVIFAVMVFVGYIIIRFYPAILHSAYRFRYLIAIVILVICVIFELSGSSIAYLGNYIGSADGGTLFGIPRGIRVDEYGVLTPFSCSQYYNHSGLYPYFSETIRGTMTDTAIVYGLPSWSVATVFRPTFWGYLLFGPAKGLSFFWVSRFLALFLVSFEFAMLYTRRNKWLSLTFSLLICFAPTIQWWFAINELIEMLVFGQSALLCVYYYIRTKQIKYKIILPLVFFWCAGGYILAFYPAWQVPLIYVFAAMFIYIILTERRQFTFVLKRDLPVIAGSMVLLAASLVCIYIKSQDTIAAVMNTVYPGGRTSTGGGGFLQLFKYGAGIFLPLFNSGLNTNACETSAFFDLFPLGLLLSFYVIFIEKKKDRMLIPLLAVQAILLIFCVFGLPMPIAKISLLNHTTIFRTILATGFVNILLLIRSLSLIERKPKTGYVIGLAIVLSVAVGLLCRFATGSYIGLLKGAILFIILFIGFALALLSVSQTGKKRFTVFCIAILVLSGGLVNPVQKGLATVYENDTVEAVQSISENDDGLWIVEHSYPVTNIPIMVGAPTINSTNVYPDIDRWHLLDPDGQYEDVYNRYAHIEISLTEEDTAFELLNPDLFFINLNYGDLSKLNVKYILTSKDYDHFENVHFRLTKKAESGEFRIYEVTYTE